MVATGLKRVGSTAKAVVDTLSKLLSPTNVDTNPQKVPNSDFA